MLSNYIKSIYKSQFSKSPYMPDLHIILEDQLLLNCIRIDADLDKISESLNPDLNWNYILETAQEHRISPPIYYNLEKVTIDKVPADVFLAFLFVEKFMNI